MHSQKDMEGDGDRSFCVSFSAFRKSRRDIAGKDEQKDVFAHRYPKLDHFFYFIPVVAFFFLLICIFFLQNKIIQCLIAFEDRLWKVLESFWEMDKLESRMSPAKIIRHITLTT